RRRRHTRSKRDWSSDVCSSDLCLATTKCATQQPRCSASTCQRSRASRISAWWETKMINFYDSIELATKPRRTDDGYLVATAKVARSGIQLYAGREVGRPDLKQVRVFRPEEEVFSDAVMSTFAYRPMTNDHPSEPVTAKNWRDLAIGQIGAEVARDGDFIRVPLVLMDAQAIEDYENGKRELSMGYSATLEWSDGVTPDGEAYDCIQRNIKNNHLALVDKARAGEQARIGDSGGHQQPKTNHERGTKMGVKIIHDGITLEVSEQAAEVIAELNKRIVEAQATAAEAGEQVDAKDKELADKDAEIEKLKAAQLDDEALAKKVAERADLVAKAKTIVDMEYSGTEQEIKRAAVTALLGDSATKDKSDAYIDARFDIALEDVGSNDGDQSGGHNHNDSSNTDADERYRKR